MEGLGQPIPLCVANVSGDCVGLNSLCLREDQSMGVSEGRTGEVLEQVGHLS